MSETKICEKLSDEEMEQLKKVLENDYRAVSENLINEFIDGRFSEFSKFVKIHKNELVVCFRGNSKPECIIVYYNNHIFWKFSITKDNKCNVEISYDHASFLKSEERLAFDNELGKLGFSLDKEESMVSCSKDEKFNAEFVEKSYCILKSVFKSFFSLGEIPDSEESSKKKKLYIEKQWQQRLFKYYKNINKGLFVYDLEFVQKFEIGNLKAKMQELVNEPDMLAIRFEESKPVALVLIEVKSTGNSITNDDTGIGKHLPCMKEYSEFQGKDGKKIFVEQRKKDAIKILGQYERIGIYEELKEIKKEYFKEYYFMEKLKVEKLLILTDNKSPQKRNQNSAIDYYRSQNPRKKVDIDKIAQINACEVRLIQGHYFEENISDVIVFQPTGDKCDA